MVPAHAAQRGEWMPGIAVRSPGRTRNATLARYGLSFVIPLGRLRYRRYDRAVGSGSGRGAAESGGKAGRLNSICISSAVRAFGDDLREFGDDGDDGGFPLLVRSRKRRERRKQRSLAFGR